MSSGVHQPLRITEHIYQQIGISNFQSVELRESYSQFWRTTGVQYHHVGLSPAECLREVTLARSKVGNRALDVTLFHLSAKCSRKTALLTGRVVAVDNHRVVVSESLRKVIDGGRCLGGITLVHLIDVLVIGQLRCVDRERYQQLYLMLLYECRQSIHLL